MSCLVWPHHFSDALGTHPSYKHTTSFVTRKRAMDNKDIDIKPHGRLLESTSSLYIHQLCFLTKACHFPLQFDNSKWKDIAYKVSVTLCPLVPYQISNRAIIHFLHLFKLSPYPQHQFEILRVVTRLCHQKPLQLL